MVPDFLHQPYGGLREVSEEQGSRFLRGLAGLQLEVPSLGLKHSYWDLQLSEWKFFHRVEKNIF